MLRPPNLNHTRLGTVMVACLNPSTHLCPKTQNGRKFEADAVSDRRAVGQWLHASWPPPPTPVYVERVGHHIVFIVGQVITNVYQHLINPHELQQGIVDTASSAADAAKGAEPENHQQQQQQQQQQQRDQLPLLVTLDQTSFSIVGSHKGWQTSLA